MNVILVNFKMAESIAGITIYQEGNMGKFSAASSFKIIVFLSIIYLHLGRYIDKKNVGQVRALMSSMYVHVFLLVICQILLLFVKSNL